MYKAVQGFKNRTLNKPTIQKELEKNGSPRAEFFTDEDRRAMRIRIPIHLAFLEADDEVLLPDSYEKATKKVILS